MGIRGWIGVGVGDDSERKRGRQSNGRNILTVAKKTTGKRVPSAKWHEEVQTDKATTPAFQPTNKQEDNSVRYRNPKAMHGTRRTSTGRFE